MKRLFNLLVLALFVSALLISCGGGGGGSAPAPPPLIQALLFSFPTGSVPPAQFPNALASVTDSSTGANITTASVTMNGVTLIYNGAPTHQEYEGNVTVMPGGSVTLTVTVGGNTYTASGTQFTSYPTIATPLPGSTWTASNANTVTWSGGAPLTDATYLLGVLDTADPVGGTAYFQGQPTGVTYFSIPPNSLTAGDRVVIVGVTTPVFISNAAAGSALLFGGYNYVPITVMNGSNASLVSIAVTPSNPTVSVGTAQQFRATGTYSDNSTADITNAVTWISSDTSVATISNAAGSNGLAQALSQGPATITASLGAVSGSTSLLSNPAGTSVQTVSLATNDIIFDSLRGIIYASVPSRAGGLGNTIASIDPVSGITVTSVFVGSEPGKLAISDDSQFLYVSLNGAAAVRRVTLATMTPDIQFSLGSDSFGPRYAEDMVVLPGFPNAVAISTKYLGVSPRFAGVAIYDDGVQRAVTIPDFIKNGGGHCINAIISSATASTLYGYNNETTEFGFYRMSINSSGVSIADVTDNLITGFGVDIAFGGGLVYATSGQVVNPSDTAPTLAGSFSGVSFAGAVEPDSPLGKTFFVFGAGPYTVSAFDQTTFVSLGSLSVQGNSGTSSSLIRWGTNGLAFRTSGDQLFLIKSSLVQ